MGSYSDNINLPALLLPVGYAAVWALVDVSTIAWSIALVNTTDPNKKSSGKASVVNDAL